MGVETGLEVLLDRSPGRIAGQRIALVAHPASVDRRLCHAIDRLQAAGASLTCLFAPEHGVRGEAQDMEAVAAGRDTASGLPIHSLYGSTMASLEPGDDELAGLDLLLFDLQDVGARYYTYAATLFSIMERAAGHQLKVLVLDRPNPLGGEVAEGPGLAADFHSFVGRLDVPVRHGLTVGEMARLFKLDSGLEVDLEVVPMRGWRRDMLWPDTGLPWVLPSPNMPTPDTVTVYPGGCLVEGTNLSEGRGTTRPFECVGAPWIDGQALAAELNDLHLSGVHFRAHWFRPVAHKWKGETCAGVQVHVTDPRQLRSFTAYVALLAAARRQDPARFAWRTEAYEFVTDRLAIDLLGGSEQLRLDIEAGRPLAGMAAEWDRVAVRHLDRCRQVLLYGSA